MNMKHWIVLVMAVLFSLGLQAQTEEELDVAANDKGEFQQVKKEFLNGEWKEKDQPTNLNLKPSDIFDDSTEIPKKEEVESYLEDPADNDFFEPKEQTD